MAFLSASAFSVTLAAFFVAFRCPVIQLMLRRVSDFPAHDSLVAILHRFRIPFTIDPSSDEHHKVGCTALLVRGG